MPKFDAVVWDWNGTLLDDAQLCVVVINEMLTRRSLPCISLAFYRAVIEFPVVLYYEKLGFDFSSQPFEEISDEFVSLYQAGWRRCVLQVGAAGALAALKAGGVGQSVLSASLSRHLREQLEFFDITGFLDSISGADNHHGRGKLHIAREHAEALGADPKRTLFIGDTAHDVEVAREAGCACLLVSFGHYNHERLAYFGLPVAVSMKDVLEFIL